MIASVKPPISKQTLNFLRYKLTLAAVLILIAVVALCIKFLWMPAREISENFDTYFTMGGVEHLTPFWPQYWRRLRNIPKPIDPAEIVRSDDGGLVVMAVIVIAGGLLVAYKFRKYLVRRV